MLEKETFSFRNVSKLIIVNWIFNPNIQTSNKVQKQTFNPKFLAKKS